MNLNLCAEARWIKRLYAPQLLKIMKLTILLITLACLQVSARSFAQISISKKNVPLAQVLGEIQKQTGYSFFYKHKLIENIRVSPEFRNVTLQQALDRLLEGLPLTYEVIDKTVAIKEKVVRRPVESAPAEMLPKVKVEGRVVDTAGQPLPGATVTIKGSGKRVIADQDGRFAVLADNGDVLVISYVGYLAQTVTVGDGANYQVILHDDPKGLKEIVVNTGYEHISKERATGSFDFIDNKKFNEQVGTTVLDRLAAITNSVTFNKSANGGDPVTGLTIRGLSTINGGRSPLIVVDNFPYNGDLSNLNPNDVENITILKDAAAASIWGVKAGNGVIVITTKRGRFRQKMNVSVNTNTTLLEKPDLGSIRQISSADFIDLEKELFSLGAYSRSEKNTRNRPALSPVVELLIQARDGKISSGDADAQIEAMKLHDVRDDFNKYIYQLGVNQQHAINVNGGSETVAYNVSAGYDKNIDNLNARFDRTNFSSQNTFKPLRGLELTAGFNFSQTGSTSGRPAYGSITGNGYGSVPVYTRLADDHGNAIPVYLLRKPFIDTLGGGKLLNWTYNPLDDYNHSYSKVGQLDFLVNTSAAYRIADFLRVRVDYQYEKQTGTNTSYNDVQSYYTRNLINSATQIPQDGSPLVYPVPLGDIQSQIMPSSTVHQVRTQINFDKSWGKNQLVALLGGEIRSVASEQRQSIFYGFDPRTSVSTPVDYVDFFPNIIGGAGISIPSNEGRYTALNRFVSAFANAAYTYDGKYTLSASARRDASNIFGATTNNRWKPLWSAGAGWEIDKESFYHLEFLPYLKLRATYGHSGNVSAAVIGVTTLNYIGTDIYAQKPSSDFLSYENPDLRWEDVATTNFGLDFGLKNNRISGSVEYYTKRTSDLYGPAVTDYTAVPTFTITKNVASTSGHGIDLQLNTRNLQGKLTWDTKLNLTWYKDKVISYYLSDTSAGAFAGNRYRISAGGVPAIYGVYSYPWAGLNPATGAPQGYLNGQVSTDYLAMRAQSFRSLIYNGPATPTIFGNFSNSVQWKGVSFTINIGYRFGYYFQKPSLNYTNILSTGKAVDYAERWQKPGDELRTNVPSFVYPFDGNRDAFYAGSSVLVEKGDNIRINFLRLSYSVPATLLKRIGLNSLNIYSNASNFSPLWTANKDGLDPENLTIKVSPIFSLGLNASF